MQNFLCWTSHFACTRATHSCWLCTAWILFAQTRSNAHSLRGRGSPTANQGIQIILIQSYGGVCHALPAFSWKIWSALQFSASSGCWGAEKQSFVVTKVLNVTTIYCRNMCLHSAVFCPLCSTLIWVEEHADIINQEVAHMLWTHLSSESRQCVSGQGNNWW